MQPGLTLAIVSHMMSQSRFTTQSTFLLLAGATLIAIALSGCGRAEFAFENGGSFSQTEPPTVCSPFDPANPPSNQNGLAGSIQYLEASQPRYSSVLDMVSKGKDAGVKLILSQLDVPTVAFTKGFVDSKTGAALKTSSGDTLIEWFSIDVRSELLLSDTDSAGFYQLALLSDDGAVLNIDATLTDAGTLLVDNDGEHPTRMGCASKGIELKKNISRPIRVKFYQGPRYHIALTLMWRKVSAENSATDANCGLTGNDVFWDSTKTPSLATAKYNELLTRGWKVVPSKNFILPSDVRSNPCVK